MTPSDVKATLSFSDGSPTCELPIYKGTIGPDVIDIRKLYAQTGKFTYDPGFLSTAVLRIGDHLHRRRQGRAAVPRLPDRAAREQLRLPRNLLPAAVRRPAERRRRRTTSSSCVTNHTMVNEQMQFFLRGFRRDAHPMAVMTGLVGALSAFYHDSTDINNPQHREISAIRLIAKMPTLVAMAYKYSVGQPYMYPKNRPQLRRRTSCT